MGKYSKAIGTVIGALIGLGVSLGFLPESFQSPEVIGAITTITGLIGTIFAPKNAEA